MGKMKRINHIIQGILMIILAILLMSEPELLYDVILGIICVTLFVKGINQLLYFLTLARYMVGGSLVFWRALLTINIGIQVGYLTAVPNIYVMIYLSVGLAFSGLIDVLHAFETKKTVGVRWKLKMVQGGVTILIALVGLLASGSTQMVVYFYGVGVIVAAITRITDAFRSNKMVYIS